MSHAALTRFARFSGVGLGIALVVANLLAFWYFARSWPQYGNQGFSGYRLDLDVYRIGSTIWRHGGSLYGPLPATTRGLDLPFTYPPAAAIVFAPLSLLPFWLASVTITILTVAALLVVLALVVRAVAELLCSPISWSHHWVWLVPLFLGLAALGRRPAIVLLVVGLVLCCLGPQWWFPKGLDRELSWPLWAKFVGSSYVYYGIAVLVTAALKPGDRTARQAGRGRGEIAVDARSYIGQS